MRPGLRARHRKNHGPLTSDQIVGALRKCSDSAYDLYQSGKLLNHAGPKTTASAVIVLALEEYGRIGWLYLGLMLPPDDDDPWAYFWDGFYSHRLKSEVAHELNLGRSNLLPAITRFLRHDVFSFSATSQALVREKQAVLYTDYDAKRREFPGIVYRAAECAGAAAKIPLETVIYGDPITVQRGRASKLIHHKCCLSACQSIRSSRIVRAS